MEARNHMSSGQVTSPVLVYSSSQLMEGIANVVNLDREVVPLKNKTQFQ